MAVAIVIVNTYEPEGEVAGRLLALAEEKGHSPGDVVAQRGEHNAALSFQVPQDVADAFSAERAERWPVPEDAPFDHDGDPSAPVRTSRPGKAKE